MTKFPRAIRLIAACVALAAWSGIAQAQTISINFSTNGNGGGDDAPLAPSDVAGVVAVSNWNDLSGPSGSAMDLVDSTGATTTTDISWAANNSWGGTAVPAPADPDARMITAWLDDGGQSITVSDIPFSVYDVYIYGSTDGDGNAGKFLTWDVNGINYATTGVFVAPASANGDYWFGSHVDGSTGADNPTYLKIPGQVGTLSISGLPNSGASRGAVSGIQIVQGTAEASIRLTVDRDTGEGTLVNMTGSPIEMAGLSILSDAGALNPAGWKSISDNYDQGGSVSADEWLEFASSGVELGEATLGSGTIANGQSVDLGTVWAKFPTEDVVLEYLDANSGETIVGAIQFTGATQTAPYAAGDYNFDGQITDADWPTQRDGYAAGLTGGTLAEGYALGDFDLDGDSDLDDLLGFKAAFVAAGNSLAELSAVPEPASLALLAACGLLATCRRWARGAIKAAPLAALAMLALGGAEAQAASIGVSYAGDNGGGTGVQITPTQTAGVVPQNNWNAATGQNGTLSNLVNDSGAATGAEVTWTSPNTWGGSGATTDDEAMVNGWLDDNGGNTTTVTGIPFSTYDVYVYGSSDAGNAGRGWNVTINGTNMFSAPGVFEDPVTANGSYFDNAYIDGSTGANNPSYFFATGLTGDLTIEGLRQDAGGIDSRGAVSGFQIVEPGGPPIILTLEINTTTGVGLLKNTTANPVTLDFYEITSGPSESLTPDTWNSLEDQDFEGNGAPGTGNGWEEVGAGGGLGPDRLAEFYLDGDSTLAAGQIVSLGRVFDAGSGVEDDIAFRYNDLGSLTRDGLVTFVTGGGIDGDFDGDTDVDGRDFLLAQRSNPGVNIPLWEANFGTGVAASAAASAVPEPASLALSALLATALAAGRRPARTRALCESK